MFVLVFGMSLGCLTEIDPEIAPQKDLSKDAPQSPNMAQGVPQKVDSPEGSQQGAPQDEGDLSKPPPTHPAVSIANAFLAAVASEKEEAVQQFLPSSQKGRSVQELRQKSFGQTEITNLRMASDSLGERAVQAKIKVEGDKVHVLGLSLERGQYRFASFFTLSVSEYQSSKELWSK